MLQKLLARFKVSTKLAFLVFILCATIIAIGAYGLSQMSRMDASTQDLYNNRVVCMEQLVNVRHAYAKNIVFALQELKDGTISYHEVEKRMDAAYTEIGTNWQAYKLTYLTPEEAKLASEAEIMMHQADSAITDEKSLLDKSDTSNFSDLHPVKLFNITYALVEKLNQLLKLQVTVSKDIIENSNQEYKATVRTFYLLIGSVLSLGVLLFLAILFDTKQLIENLQSSNLILSENQEKYRYLFDNNPAFIIIWDPESLKILEVNDLVLKKYGYTKDEWSNMTVLDYRPKEDYARIKEFAAKIQNENTPVIPGIWRHLKKSGEEMLMEISSHKILYENRVAALSLSRDVTENVKAAEEIKKRESEFSVFFNNIENASCLLDTDKKYVIFNKQFIKDHIRLTGTEPKVGQLVYDLFPPEVQAERRRLIDKVLQSGTGKKIEIDVDYLRGGRRYYYRTAFNPVITDGKITGVSTISIDLTDIKEAEQKFKDLVEKSLTGVYIYDYEKFAYVNPRLTEIFGYTEEELLAMNPVSAIHEDDLQAVLENLKQRQEDTLTSFYYTARARKKDGTIIWIEVLGTATTYKGKKASIGSILDITESKKAELELKKTEEKNRAVIENISDAIFLMDEKTVSYYHSPSVQKIFGYTFEDTHGDTVFKYIHPDEAEEARKLFSNIAANPGITFQNQFRVRHKNGSYIWVEGTATNLLNNESVKAIILNCRDISERKKDEIEILQLNRLYLFISEINESILRLESREEIFSEACRIAVDVGKFRMAWIGVYDESKDQITPAAWAGYEDGFFKATKVEEMKVSTSAIPSARAIRMKTHFYYDDIENDTDIPNDLKKEMLKRKYLSGISLPIFVDSKIVAAIVLLMSEPFFFNDTEVKLLREVTDNITYALDKIRIRNLQAVAEQEVITLNESLEGKVIERTAQLQESEEKLKDTSRFLDTVLDNIPDMVFVKDVELKYLLMNKAGENLLGWKKEELIGKTYYDILPENIAREYTLADQKLLSSGELLDIEEERLANKRNVQVHTRKFVIKGDDGTPQYIIGITRDISQQKAQEEKIRNLNTELEQNVVQLKESNKELESFSYSVSHDLRTPLTIIHGYAQVLLQEDSKFDKDTMEMLRAIMGNAEKMAELIDDILALSKAVKTEAKIVKLDMTEMATTTYKELEKSMSGSVKADITINPLLPCYADHNLIMQVFTNLLSNAIKYSSHAAKPKIIVDSYKQGRENIYSVKDNGAGFDMKNYDKLFGVFQRLHSSREFEGTGVGLALVKRIITKHSGRVWAEAEPGKGATFYFSLPNIKR